MAKRSKKEGEDEVEEEPSWMTPARCWAHTGGTRCEEGDSEVVPEGGDGSPEFFKVRNLPPQLPHLANPTAMIVSACDGDDIGIRVRSVVALTVSCSTPSDHCAVGLEPNAVIAPA